MITEGVYWPAIPAGVVSNARAFAARLAAPRERTAFMAKVRKAAPGAGDTPGSVRIVHTSGGYHGPLQAAAVYSTGVPSPSGGKAQILRFDETGARMRLNEEASTEPIRQSIGDSFCTFLVSNSDGRTHKSGLRPPLQWSKPNQLDRPSP